MFLTDRSTPSKPIPLGFAYRFYGVTYSTVRLCNAGYLLWDPTVTSCQTSGVGSLPNYYPGTVLAFWSTNIASPTAVVGTPYGYRVDGTPGQRVFTLIVNGARYSTDYSTLLTMYVKLFESDSSIEIHYRSAQRSSGYDYVTIGIQNNLNYGSYQQVSDSQYYNLNDAYPSAATGGSFYSVKAIRTTTTTYTPPDPYTPGAGGSSGDDGIGGGEIAGIVLGTVAFFAIIYFCVLCCKKASDNRGAANAAARLAVAQNAYAQNNNSGAHSYRPLADPAPQQPVVGQIGMGPVRQQVVQPYNPPMVVPPAYNAAYGMNVPPPMQNNAGGAVGAQVGGGGYLPPPMQQPVVAIAYNPGMSHNQMPPQQQPVYMNAPPPAFGQNQMPPVQYVAAPTPNAPPPPSYDSVTGGGAAAPGGKAFDGNKL